MTTLIGNGSRLSEESKIKVNEHPTIKKVSEQRNMEDYKPVEESRIILRIYENSLNTAIRPIWMNQKNVRHKYFATTKEKGLSD